MTRPTHVRDEDIKAEHFEQAFVMLAALLQAGSEIEVTGRSGHGGFEVKVLSPDGATRIGHSQQIENDEVSLLRALGFAMQCVPSPAFPSGAWAPWPPLEEGATEDRPHWLPGDEPASEDLHYAGAIRATVTRDGDCWRVTFPDGVYTLRPSLKLAKHSAENNVAGDADLPEVPR